MMMLKLTAASVAAAAILGIAAVAPARGAGPEGTLADESRPAPPVLNFTMKDIDGKEVSLGGYQGQVILIVNVATFCGNTPQYASLQTLYERYKEQGFTVLAFPANEFGKQEPGTNQEIKEFCTGKYHVTFPVFSKIIVKGEGQAPLYRFLTDKKSNPASGGDIEWNFAKFLVNRKGEVVARFPAGKDPLKPDVVAAIEKELAAPKP
jgi:glutathione peroxidase